MKLRNVILNNQAHIQINQGSYWVNVHDIVLHHPTMSIFTKSILDILSATPHEQASLLSAAKDVKVATQRPDNILLPFQPLSYRDFMIFEQHAINAARGFAQRYIKAYPVTRLYERVTGKVFPAFRPKPLWYEQPIYYMGNHLAFIPDGSPIPWPAYCSTLDYELELGFVLSKPLYNATPQQAEAAIGGFVIFNDLSARNVQIKEMNSGFGPQKSKHFCNIMGSEVVTPDEILPNWTSLTGSVIINGKTVAQVSAQSPKFTLGEMLAHASSGEYLYPGEFFGTGTLPGGSGMENGHTLHSFDELELNLMNFARMKSVVRDFSFFAAPMI